MKPAEKIAQFLINVAWLTLILYGISVIAKWL